MFAIDVLIPVPPVNCRVSVPKEIVSLPESEEILRSVEIVEVDAAVILPFVSTVITGIAVEDPYELAVTAVLSRLNVTS